MRIDRSAFRFSSPQRFDVVAIRRPECPDRMLVKRVLGLPGESISVRSGKVYVNGSVPGRTAQQRRQGAVLVHDDSWRPPTTTAPRGWRPIDPRSAWRSTAHGIVWAREIGSPPGKAPPVDGVFDWLVFVGDHQPPRSLRTSVSWWLTDDDPYAPHVSRVGHPVDSLLWTGRIRWNGAGQWRLVLRGARFVHSVDLRFPEGEVLAYDGTRLIWRGCLPAGRIRQPATWHEMELSSFDQRLELVVDGEGIFSAPLSQGERSEANGGAGPAAPLAMGAWGIELEVRELRVLRDVYREGPTQVQALLAGGSNVSLGLGEYYVLGDNATLSDDFREGVRGPVIERKWIVGKVLRIGDGQAIDDAAYSTPVGTRTQIQ